jgi:PAS domain-containing protein
MFSHAGHPIFVLDPVSDRIRYANRCACSLLGYAVGELLAMPASAIFRAERVALEALREAIEEQGESWTTTLALRTRAGGLLAVELLALSLNTDEGRYILVLGTDRSQ